MCSIGRRCVQQVGDVFNITDSVESVYTISNIHK